MKYHRPRLRFRAGWVLAILTAITATPVIAQTANFDPIKLSSNFETVKKVTVSGYTGGSYSLSAIRNRDDDKNACFGYADTTPDHILVLEQDFSNLQILINSGGYDTTLLIRGPEENIIHCGDDTGKSKDASISNRKWQKGTYKIWVGTFNSDVRRDYTLTVQLTNDK